MTADAGQAESRSEQAQAGDEHGLAANSIRQAAGDTAGGSLVRQFSPKLQLGIELTGAITKEFQLGKGQLQTLFGGNYQFKNNASFDFGLIGGKYAASPRFGVQLGLSIDF